MPESILSQNDTNNLAYPGDVPLSELPIIAHADKFVLKIMATESNVNFLEHNFTRLLNELRTRLGCDARDVSLGRIRHGTGAVCLGLNAAFSRIQIFPHKRLGNFFLAHRRFPTLDEMMHLLFQWSSSRSLESIFDWDSDDIDDLFSRFHLRWIASVVITHRENAKWNYRPHVENIQIVTDALEQHLQISPWTLEIAFDTRDYVHASYMRRYCSFSRPPSYNQVFHINERNGQKQPGPSPNGYLEYFGYRAKRMTDTRSNSDRPRGGHRQLFTYRRIVNIAPNVRGGFCRIELRLYRGYLNKSRRIRRMGSCRELLDSIEEIAMANLVFIHLDWIWLYRRFPRTRFLGLQCLSTKGMLAKLQRAGFALETIEPYLTRMPTPDIFL